MTRRAVLYARVSGDDRGKDGRNLAGQLDMCRDYALKQSWEIVAELSEDDRGASGASFELAKLGQVLEMAQAGGFDVLAVRELDRLSRNLAKQLIVEEELKRHGVDVEYVLGDYPDTPEGRLNKHIRATISEYEREKIVERMVRAKRLKCKAGSVLVFARPPYGYKVEEKGNRFVLVVREQEAQIVRLIFTCYTEGNGQNGPMRMADIIGKLHEIGAPTYADLHEPELKKRGWAQWSRASIYNVFRNETYAGVWHYGKEGGGDRIPVQVPAIVGREMWEAAQSRLAANKQDSPRNTKYEYLLAKHVHCAVCGSKVAGQSRKHGEVLYRYYRCPAKKEYARKCDAPSFRSDHLDAAVWEWIKSFLTDPEALVEGLEGYRDECERENLPTRERLAVVTGLIDDNRAQLSKLLDLYLSGDFPKEMLTERKVRLEATIAALEREQAGLVAHLKAQTLTEEQIRTLMNFAAMVSENLAAMDGDFDARRRLMVELDVQATLAVEDGEKVVYASCIVGEEVLSIASRGSTHPSRRSAPWWKRKRA